MHILYEHIINELKLHQKYYFFIILSIKLIISLFFFSAPVENWYIPFMQNIISSSFDIFYQPYNVSNGLNIFFPYGYGFIIILLPGMFLSNFLNFDPNISYFLTIATADLLIYYYIKKIIENKSLNLFLFYWCNPVIILSAYYLGLNDLIPILFIVIALYNIKLGHVYLSCLSIGFAISCKISMGLVLPLLIIYFHHNKQLRKYFWKFTFLSIFLTMVFEIPHLMSSQAREMLFNNTNALETIFLEIGFIGGKKLLIFPILYSSLLLVIWHIGRISFRLLVNLLTIMFLTTSFISDTSPGWFMWAIPLLAMFEGDLSFKDKMLIYCFCFFVVLKTLLLGPLGFYDLNLFSPNFSKFEFLEPHIDIIYSIFFSIGILLVMRLWTLGIISNDYYKFWRKPLVVGISGDSGVGKTTLTNGIEKIFGQEAITHVKGDGYHIWDRNKSIWNNITHLNPRANELSRLNFDVQKLINGKSIKTSYYDHIIGKKILNNYKSSNNFIIIEGLHVFSLPMLRNQCDVKIFLDFEETLRTKMKISRDTEKRGYTEIEVLNNLKRRKKDSLKYIDIQKEFADIIIKIISTPNYWTANKNKRLVVEVKAKQPLYYEELAKVLVYGCNLGVEVFYGKENKLIINGYPKAEEIRFAAKKLINNNEEIFSLNPVWYGGIKGIVQLLGVVHIAQSIRQRLV